MARKPDWVSILVWVLIALCGIAMLFMSCGIIGRHEKTLDRVDHLPSITWDKDQLLTCVYLLDANRLICMQPEEYLLLGGVDNAHDI